MKTGTSIVNNINGSGYEALGWGTSFVVLNDVAVLDPPLSDRAAEPAVFAELMSGQLAEPSVVSNPARLFVD